MEKIKRLELENNASSFFTSFTDVVLLLLVFFIYLYSISTINRDKFQKITEGVKKNLGFFSISSPSTALRINDDKPVEVIANRETDLDTSLMVSLQKDILFEIGSSKLTPDAQQYLTKLANAVIGKNVLVIVEGHTDASPIRSTLHESNWNLSASRAASVCAWLEKKGVESKYLKAVSFGVSRPKSIHDNTKNRRVEIFIKPLPKEEPTHVD